LSADPAAVFEKSSTLLSAVATMDDGTLVHVGGGDAGWTLLDGPISDISINGLATAGEVFINSPASIRGLFDGVNGDLDLIVLNRNVVPPGGPFPSPTFTELDFQPGQAGLYQGLLVDGNGNVIGSLSGLKLGVTGGFSGRLIFNGKTYTLRGTLDSNGDFTGGIPRKNLPAIDVTLRIGQTSGGGLALEGTVVGDGTSGSAHIARTPYNGKTNPAPAELVKRFTFLVPATQTGDPGIPGGDGYGAASVNSSGVIVATVRTGDGLPFSSRGFLTDDDQWHLFQPLYRGQGQLAGVISFREVPSVSDFDGLLRWVRNPNPRSRSYPLGFDLPPWLVGSLFDPSAPGERALDELADQHYNAKLTLAGNTAPNGGLSKVLSWLGNNGLVYYGPERLSAKANPKNGLLVGSFLDPATRAKISFGGAVLQKQGIAGGNFLFANEAGYLLIEPGTVFPYPGSEDAGPLDLTILPPSSAVEPTVVDLGIFDPLAAGLFGGILKSNPGGAVAGGLEGVKLGASGTVSGVIWIEGKRFSFRGTMGADGIARILIPRNGLPPVDLELRLALANGLADAFQFTGRVEIDGSGFDIQAQRRPVFSKLVRSPNEGQYTIAMRAPTGTDTVSQPGGDGYGSLRVLYTGDCIGLMILADGSRSSMAGHLSRAGEWSLHRSLYGGRGYVAGKMAFREVTGISDVDGTWRWFKPAGVPKTTNYAPGFEVARTVIGATYLPPPRGVNAFGALDDTLYNAWLRLSGPDLAPLTAAEITNLDRTVTWNAANRIFYFGPDQASIRFNPATGLATGSYVDRSTGASVRFGGALMQEQALLTGSYLSGGQSGIVTISPR
jgi:hypothetical protein